MAGGFPFHAFGGGIPMGGGTRVFMGGMPGGMPGGFGGFPGMGGMPGQDDSDDEGEVRSPRYAQYLALRLA